MQTFTGVLPRELWLVLLGYVEPRELLLMCELSKGLLALIVDNEISLFPTTRAVSLNQQRDALRRNEWRLAERQLALGSPCMPQIPRNGMVSRPARYTVGVVGSGGVGKTALVTKFVEGFFRELSGATAEVCTKQNRRQTIDSQTMDWDIFDFFTPRVIEEFACLADNWLVGCHCFVLVFDVTDETTFRDLSVWLEKIFRIKDICPTEVIPAIIFGNKTDLLQDDTRHAVEMTRIKELGARFCSQIQETNGSHAVFEDLYRHVYHLHTHTKGSVPQKCELM